MGVDVDGNGGLRKGLLVAYGEMMKERTEMLLGRRFGRYLLGREGIGSRRGG